MEALVEQAKATTGPVALSGIIGRALSSKSIFAFGELLDLPSIQALSSTPNASHLALLELFAYGTYADYTAGRASGKFGELPPEQLLKLRMLTVATLAGEQSVLDFAALGPALGLEGGDLKAIEDVVLAAVTAGLVTGRVDQRRGRLEVSGAQVRDVQPSPEAIDALLAKLAQWKAAVAAASDSARKRLEGMGADAAVAAREAAEFKKRLEEGKRSADKEAEQRLAEGRGGGAAGGGRRRAGGPGAMAGMFGSGPMGMGMGMSMGMGGDDLDVDEYDGGGLGMGGASAMEELLAATAGARGAGRRTGGTAGGGAAGRR